MTTPDGEFVEVKGLRVTFNVSKTRVAEQNVADISIMNLAESTRRKIVAKNSHVSLLAGYEENTGLLSIFEGQIIYGHTEIAPPEVITDLQVGDGAHTLRETRVAVSFSSGATLAGAIRKLAGAMQLPLLMPTPVRGRFINGYSFEGPARRALTQILKAERYEWSVQDGELQVLPEFSPLDKNDILISPSTGLLSTPEPINYNRGQLDNSQEPEPQWRVRSLLQPELKPGKLVVVESSAINGTFLVENAQHVGDSDTGEFSTIVEVRELV